MDNKINPNIYTSYIFFINVLVGLIVRHYTYALIFLILVITSIIHHSMLTDTTKNIDKSVVLLVVIYINYFIHFLYFDKFHPIYPNRPNLMVS